MDVEQQQGTWTQLSLFEEEVGSVRPDAGGEGGTGSAACEEWQASTASNRERALTSDLMERVCERGNLNRAYKRVKANKGAPGIDGMTVGELYDWLKEHKGELVELLLDGSYKPQPVLGKEIDKPSGGKRRLGIPTVVDRLVQQAILQVLEGIVDPTFSESSYGFRRGRNAHQAVKQAAEYVAEGRNIVVDVDLAKFFDRVNHDMLMARVARHVSDKRLLRVIRRFLEAGMMWDGVCVERYEGTPQGGPQTPPTMLRTAPCGAQVKRVGCYPEYDIDFFFADLNTFDERPDEFTFGGPIGLGQAAVDLRGELF
ncbi:MAG: reverse transcriptase domain-containing protein [Anaerolineae bacterium]|jgi:RNA-directed DNA polymerase